MFTCGNYVETIMTKEDYLKSKYAPDRIKSPEKAEKQLIDSYFPQSKVEEEKSLKYSSYVDVSLDEIKLESAIEPQDPKKIPLSKSGIEESKTEV